MRVTNEIKRIFLSFAQQYFRDVHPTLTWNVDPRQTKIFIGDKFIAAPAVYEQMPSIILSRGDAAFAQTSIDQMQSMDRPVWGNAKQRTDLIRSSITYNCLSQNGIEAEEIAATLFTQIVGYKDQFRSNGIHQIMGISMGEERIIRGDVVPRLYLVPINVVFTVHMHILTTENLYEAVVKIDTEQAGQLQDDFWRYNNNLHGYVVSGLTLLFAYPPSSGIAMAVDFTGAITLNEYVNYVPSGLVDGLNTVFTLPEPVYTPYALLSGLYIYVSGISLEV